MISNSELLFKKAAQYQRERADVVSKYEEKLKSLSRFAGSQGYEEDVAKLKKQHEQELAALIDEYRPVFSTIIDSMTDRIGRRSMPMPTTEMVNTLNLLRMKRRPTYEDCRRAAEAVKTSRLAIDVITEIAAEHKLPHDFSGLCPTMSSETATKVVDNLTRGITDFMEYDTPRSSRIAAKYYADHYNATDIKLPKRQEFTDKAGCFYELCGLNAEDLDKFCAIIDEGGTDE